MNKGLFIFFGECFREGLSCTRLVDTEFGFKNQVESSNSHKLLINNIIEKNDYTIDVAIHTYNTKYIETLLSCYNNIVYKHFSDHYYSNDVKHIANKVISDIFNSLNMSDYDFIFFCRLDILLKPEFFKLFNTDWSEIMYPNVMSVSNNDMCIANVFCFIPKKYFFPFLMWTGITNCHFFYPHAIKDLLKNGLSLYDVNFISDKTYIANTIQSKNPLWCINCRPEGPDFPIYITVYNTIEKIKYTKYIKSENITLEE